MTNYCKSYFTADDDVVFENVFTDEVQTLHMNEPFEYLQFQRRHDIMVSGDYTDQNIIKHIKALMKRNDDGSQFTHIFIYYVCDGVVDCSINLTTQALPLEMITDFVSTLLISADPDRVNEFTFEFTRPTFDLTVFRFETSR